MNYILKLLPLFLRNKLEKNPLIGNFFKVLSLDILVKASAFLLLPVYLMLMSQKDYGLYTYIMAIIAAFSSCLHFGLYVAQSKFYHEMDENERGVLVFNLNFLLAFLLFLTLSVIYFPGLDYHIISFLVSQPVNYEKYRFIILGAIIISVYAFMLQNYLMTSQKIKQLQLYNFSRLILINGVIILFLLIFPGDPAWLRVTLGFLIEFLILVFFLYYYFKEIKTKFNFNLIKRSMALSFPIMLNALLGIISNFSDRFFIEKSYDFTVLAYYNLAIVMSGVLSIVSMAFQNAYLPFFFQERDIRQNLKKTLEIRSNLIKALSLISLLIGLGLAFMFATGIIAMSYIKALYILPVMLLANIINAIGALYGNFFVLFEKTYYQFIIGTIISVLSIILNVMLIKYIGVWGAVLTTLIVSILFFIGYYFFATFQIKRAVRLN